MHDNMIVPSVSPLREVVICSVARPQVAETGRALTEAEAGPSLLVGCSAVRQLNSSDLSGTVCRQKDSAEMRCVDDTGNCGCRIDDLFFGGNHSILR